MTDLELEILKRDLAAVETYLESGGFPKGSKEDVFLTEKLYDLIATINQEVQIRKARE